VIKKQKKVAAAPAADIESIRLAYLGGEFVVRSAFFAVKFIYRDKW
jgi:hypothetical protein